MLIWQLQVFSSITEITLKNEKKNIDGMRSQFSQQQHISTGRIMLLHRNTDVCTGLSSACAHITVLCGVMQHICRKVKDKSPKIKSSTHLTNKMYFSKFNKIPKFFNFLFWVLQIENWTLKCGSFSRVFRCFTYRFNDLFTGITPLQVSGFILLLH